MVRAGDERKLMRRDMSRSSYQSKIDELNRQARDVKDEEEVGKDQVLKRNRKSARECRERKKIYIQLL